MTQSTHLDRRELTYSGVNIVDPKLFSPPHPIILDLLKTGAQIRVDQITTPIEQYNQFADVPISVPVESDYMIKPHQFVLPPQYKKLNVQRYLSELLIDDIRALSRHDQVEYVNRYDDEMEWYMSHDKIDMLRTLIYIVNVLEEHEVPWGVGRGSSISSYVLYLIGVHDINPIQYNLDWREFLRDGI